MSSIYCYTEQTHADIVTIIIILLHTENRFVATTEFLVMATNKINLKNIVGLMFSNHNLDAQLKFLVSDK